MHYYIWNFILDCFIEPSIYIPGAGVLLVVEGIESLRRVIDSGEESSNRDLATRCVEWCRLWR
jgi:hypothetical protein